MKIATDRVLYISKNKHSPLIFIELISKILKLKIYTMFLQKETVDQLN
jgi:hypothetical protein